MTSRASAAVSATRAIRMPRLPRRALSMTHSDPTRVFPYPRPARISQNDQFQVGVRCLGRAQKLHWYSSAFFSSSLSDEIGRASCRERVSISVVAVALATQRRADLVL